MVDKPWNEKTPDELIQDMKETISMYGKNMNYNYHFQHADEWLSNPVIQTLDHVQMVLIDMGFERGKIVEEAGMSLTIGVDRPINTNEVARIHDMKMIGLEFKFRTLSWWECRFSNWVIKSAYF